MTEVNSVLSQDVFKTSHSGSPFFSVPSYHIPNTGRCAKEGLAAPLPLLLVPCYPAKGTQGVEGLMTPPFSHPSSCRRVPCGRAVGPMGLDQPHLSLAS